MPPGAAAPALRELKDSLAGIQGQALRESSRRFALIPARFLSSRKIPNRDEQLFITVQEMIIKINCQDVALSRTWQPRRKKGGDQTFPYKGRDS